MSRVGLPSKSYIESPYVAGVVLGVWVLSVAPPAWAHTGGLTEVDDPFVAGLIHPILGVDHLLAMFSVGVISALIGKRAIWMVPTMFIAAMAVGSILARGTVSISSQVVEAAITASVVFLGVTIALDKRVPIRWVYGAVIFFGFFHGFAHGVETPIWANATVFMWGFVSGSILIHVQGVFIGEMSRRFDSWRPVVRIAGLVFASVGVLALAGVM